MSPTQCAIASSSVLTTDQVATIAANRPRLRAFQADAKAKLRVAFRNGRRVLIVAPTGAGKGTMAVDLMLDAALKGHVVLFVVHRAEIIIDIVGRLNAAGLHRVSVILGNDPRFDPNALVHVASIDSLRTRALPPAVLVIIDEAHRAHAAGYQNLLEKYPDAYVVGLSGTPTRLDGKPLKKIFPQLIVAVQPSTLLAEGLLAPAEVFTVDQKSLPDLEGVRTIGGDYDTRQLASRVNTPKLVGAIVEHWLKRANGRATVVFAVNIEHSKKIVAMFLAAGIAAEHVDGTETRAERQALMERVRLGETTVVCQCQLWIEGVDLPELKCAILARPSKSITVYLQAVGRVFRPFDGQSALVLDHANMVYRPLPKKMQTERRGRGEDQQRFGLPQMDRDWQAVFDLPEGEKAPPGPPLVKICPPEGEPPGCGRAIPIGLRVCECGREFPAQEIQTAEGELVEVTPEEIKAAKAKAKADPRGAIARAAFDRFWIQAYKAGYDDAWVMRRFAERFLDAPDPTWSPPARPVTVFTMEQKRAKRMEWIGVAHRMGKSPAWVAEKYRNAFAAEITELDAPAAKALPEPSADDVPALPQGEVVETEF